MGPSTTSRDLAVLDLVQPVWQNTYWIANALGLCEGLWPHASELNADHGHFFSLITKLALDAVVVGICKLYDESNPRYQKDTILSLNEHFKQNITSTFCRRLDAEILIHLGADNQRATDIIRDIFNNGDFDEVKAKIFAIIDEHIPRRAEGTPLRRLFTHRDKIVVHQDRLISPSGDLQEALKALPSFDEMEKINKWSMDFCRLVVLTLSNGSLLLTPVPARAAATNVVEKILGEKFNPSKNFN